MGTLYLWVKVLHILAVMSWMAGLLYLPRLYVNHTMVRPGSETSERFKVMERLLLKAIMGPAMIVSWGAGLAMVWLGDHLSGGLTGGNGWMWAKLLFVFLLSGMHGFLGKTRKVFEVDANQRSTRFFRIVNEVPTVLMIFIVILVIVKPF
jgi:putative membrane protein